VEHYVSAGLVHHNSGKTTIGTILALLKIQQGQPGFIAAPEFSQLGHATFPALFRWAPSTMLLNKNLNHPFTLNKTLLFSVNGAEVPVYYDSAVDYEGLTGASVNWCWLDEGARLKTRRAFDVLLARLREGPNPQFYITTTPRGQHTWFHDVVLQGKKAGELEIFFIPTRENEAHLSPGYIQTLETMYTGKMRDQELLGKFVTMSGAVFERLTEENITEAADYVEGVPTYWSCDEGFVAGHKRAICIFQVIPPFVNLVAGYSAIYELPETSIKKVLALPYPPPDVAYCDSSAAQLRGRLWESEIDTIKASHPVEDGITHLSSLICDGQGVRHLRIHPRAQEIYDELAGYAYDEVTGKPLKERDDWVDSVRYGTYHIDLQNLIEEGLANPMARSVSQS